MDEIKLLVSKEDKMLIKEEAKKNRLTVAAYVRSQLLNKLIDGKDRNNS